MTAQLSADALTLFRGERCLFQGLSFALKPGELLLLEGRNGTGKTSLMRAIAGLIEFEDGDIHWEGKPVRLNRQAFYGSLVWMQHRVGFKADLNLVENLKFEAHLRTQSGEDFEEVLQRLDIDRLKRLPLRSLSAGQQRRLALARLLVTDTTLWILDEPFTSLDVHGIQVIEDLLDAHTTGGGMLAVTSHHAVNLKNTTVQRINLSA